MDIRVAREDDAEAVHAIYAHHVLHGTASYDIDPPSLDQIRDKMQWILGQKWPFLLAELDGAVAGYAYATQFGIGRRTASPARTAFTFVPIAQVAESAMRC